MHKYFLLIAFITCCSLMMPKHTEEPTVQPSNTLFINNDIDGNLTRLDFSMDKQNVVGYKINTAGAYKIEFSAQGAATNILRGTAHGLSASGVSYPISGSDTFRIRNVSNNAVVKTIILQPSDGDIFKIIYGAKRYPNYTITQTTDYINTWVTNTLPTLKFERVY